MKEDDIRFSHFYDALEFLNIDYIFIAGYYCNTQYAPKNLLREIQTQITSQKIINIDQYKSNLLKYKHIEKMEYNENVKAQLQNFITEYESYVEELVNRVEKREDEKSSYTHNTVFELYQKK